MTTTGTHRLIAAFTRPPDLENSNVGRLVMWAGLLTGGLPCGLLFAFGIAGARPVSQLAPYGALVLLYLGLLLAICIPSQLSRWIWRHLWAFLLAIGLVCLSIQSLVGESFLQPVVVLVPLI